MFNFPSKKFSIVILLTIVIGTVFFLLLNFFKKETVFVQEGNGVTSAFTNINNQDTDGDGLKNWEERLFGTDPLVADIPQNVRVVRTQITTEPGKIKDGGNITDAFSRDLLTSLIFSGDTNFEEGDIEGALNTLLSETATFQTPQIYDASNIETVEYTPTTLKIYGNMFMKIVQKRPEANAEDTLDTFEQILRTRDEYSVGILQNIAREYSMLESGLLSISIPSGVVSLHIDFVNGVHALSQSVSDMAAALSDPLRATLGLSVYLKQLDREWEILRKVQSIFQKENVVFNKGESGSVWILFQ